MKLLVATDGSKFSDAAIRTACKFAADNAQIRVISVYEMPMAIAGDPSIGVPVYTQELMDSLCEVATKTAAKAKDKIRRKCPAAKVSFSVPLGNPSKEILDEANAWNADLIVMGSHGRGWLGRTFIGSVSDAVVHQAKCSVLVEHAQE